MDILLYLDYPQFGLLIWLTYKHLTVTTKLENDLTWIKEELQRR